MISDNTSASQQVLDEVQWTAMQYVLGELSDEHTALFEAAMAEDVTRCEAVTAAMKLTCGIALALKMQPTTQAEITGVSRVEEPVSFYRPAIARFGVFAAGAAMVLVVFATMTVQPRRGDGDFSAVDDATATALVLLLHDDSANDTNTELEELTVSDDSVSSLVAPEWLLTAVDLDAATASANHPPIGPADEAGVY